MDLRRTAITGAVAAAGATLCALLAPVARADDAQELKRQVEQLSARMQQLENKAPTQDEINETVSKYLGATPNAVLVGGADEGKAGFPLGKKPFISEGPNKVNFVFREQMRYEWFHYSNDALGVVGNGATPEVFAFSDAMPRDRSGFEIERLYFGIEGQIFCPDITFNLVLNFDADTGTGVEKEFMWIDWKYAGENHIRAGSDKVPFTYEEQNSSGKLAFVDRSLFTKAFALDSDTGVMLWGNFGSCDCPKQFLYKFFASTGEGRVDQAGSVFNTDARDTYSDQPLLTGMFEWRPTCDDFAFDEVDGRSCEERCKLQAAIGVDAYYENDDDFKENSYGFVVRTANNRVERRGYGAYARARWNGWSGLIEWAQREIDYTETSAGVKSTAPTQTDSGATIMIHYRLAESNWGFGARYSMMWLDDDYSTFTVGGVSRSYADTIKEFGVVVNYFFWDHNNKLSLDVNWVKDNSGVNSSSAGYMSASNARGVLVEDGIMVRVQWQIDF